MLTSYELYKYSIIVSFSIQQAGFITHFFSLLHLVNPPVLRYDRCSTPTNVRGDIDYEPEAQ